MISYLRKLRALALLMLSAAWIAAPASATSESISYGANLGKLNYVMTTQAAQCNSNGYGVIHYTIYSFYDFSFVSAGSGTQPISGSTYWDVGIGGRLIGSGSCPSYPSGGTITYVASGNAYTITMTPHSNGAFSSGISVPGYINPKYVVVGVVYAPPGGVVQGGVAKGNVSYTDSDLVSSTMTTKSSFGSSYTESNVVTLPGVGFNILGWVSGSVSGGSSSSYTTSTTTTDSTAVTVQKTSGTTLGVNGPECPYVGVDHDYDIIEVWLNPVQLFTLTGGGFVQPNGYGYSTLDQPGMDVYDVYAGELNGDIPVRASTTTAFARTWAAGEVWPSGQGPGLTSQDEQNILKMDPYWDCTYMSPWTNTGTTACAKPPDSTRFTESGGNQNFPYTQPAPGGSPNFQTYTLSYTNTDSQGLDVVSSSSQTVGLETVFKVSVFGLGFGDTLNQSWTTTHSYETSSQFTSSNTTTATATIWQPPCNVVSGVCSPVYPPSNAYNPITCAEISSLGQAFGQGDSMYLYQDNLFGTFLIEPYGQ